MIRYLELILNDDDRLGTDLEGLKVDAKRANAELDTVELKVQLQGVGQVIEILRKPTSEVASLVRPHRSHIDWRELGDHDFGHHRSLPLSNFKPSSTIVSRWDNPTADSEPHSAAHPLRR